jgi:acyl-CoA dehydrogenase
VFIDDLHVPADDLVGEEGRGFYYLLDGLNPERVLIGGRGGGPGPGGAEAKAAAYAKERVVFGRPIGQNQGVAASAGPVLGRAGGRQPDGLQGRGALRRRRECGAEANAAKYLGGEAGFTACEASVMAHGGMGYAKEFDVERYFREAMIARLAPVSREMILNYIAERVLGLPKSY